MTKPVDLKTLERRAYLSYHGDGLIDLYLGIVISLLSVIIVLIPDFFIFLIGGFVALIPSYTAAKNKITVPRLGYVEFSEKRRHQQSTLFLIFNVIMVFGIVFGMLAWLFPPVAAVIVAYHLIILGGAGAATFILMALKTGIQRFYPYSLITLTGFVISHIFALIIFFPMIVLGIGMIIIGSVLLYRFTRKYPKVKSSGEPYDNREDE